MTKEIEKPDPGKLALERALAESQPEPESPLPPELSPENPELSLELMRRELEDLQTQSQEYLDGWQRARAEFANYKKRVSRDQADTRARILGETLTEYLDVLDDLERALRDKPLDGDAAAWADGIELIYRKMYGMLETQGVEVIEADGLQFDPLIHEALSHEESDDHDDGDVIEVVQPGYRLGDKVLRPALVRVAK